MAGLAILKHTYDLIALVLVATDRLSWSSDCNRSSPVRLRQRVIDEHQLVPEKLLAAEVLVIGVLDPALAQHPIGQVSRPSCHA
jgi:hypothetical protein